MSDPLLLSLSSHRTLVKLGPGKRTPQALQRNGANLIIGVDSDPFRAQMAKGVGLRPRPTSPQGKSLYPNLSQ
jgi:hypothetical protein